MARLMTSPSQLEVLKPLTEQELRLQQQKRIQLYGGLSEGLRVAVQVRLRRAGGSPNHAFQLCYRFLFSPRTPHNIRPGFDFVL